MIRESIAAACAADLERRIDAYYDREAAIDDMEHVVRLECGRLSDAPMDLIDNYSDDSCTWASEVVKIVCEQYLNGVPNDTPIGRAVREKVEQLCRARAAWEVDRARGER